MTIDVDDIEDVYPVDFRDIERRFKEVAAEEGSMETVRNALNDDAKSILLDIADFIDAKVKEKYKQELKIKIINAVEAATLLGIAESKLAALSIRQEQASEGKRIQGEQAKSLSMQIKAQNPDAPFKELLHLVNKARTSCIPPFGKISETTLRAHIGPVRRKGRA